MSSAPRRPLRISPSAFKCLFWRHDRKVDCNLQLMSFEYNRLLFLFLAGLGSSDRKIITLNTHGNTNIHAYKQACYLEKIYGGCSEPVFRSPSSAHQTELIAAFPVFGMLHFLSELDAEEGEWWVLYDRFIRTSYFGVNRACERMCLSLWQAA